MDIKNKVSELYAQLPVAYALFEKDEDAAIHLLWQNQAAESLLVNKDFFTQPLFKLELMEALSTQVPNVFEYSFSPTLQQFQFVATPFEQHFVVVSFFLKPSSTAYEITETSTELDRDVNESLVSSAKLGIFQWDINQNKITLDDRAGEIIGIKASKISADYETFLKAVYHKDLNKVKDAIDEHLSADWPLSIEFRMVADNGHHAWVLFRGQAQWTKENIPVRLIASIEDISQRKHLEAELKQRESLIEQMIDALPLSVTLKDAQGCYRFFNAEAEVQQNKTRSEMIGRTDYEVYPKQLAEQAMLDDNRVRDAEQLSIYEQQLESNKWLMVGKIPIKISLPNNVLQIWLLSFSLDITQRKKMEEALKEANRIAEEAAQSKANFLSVMSHEIRTPLNSVIGNAALLMGEGLEPSTAEHVEMIKRSGEHLLYLINDILDFNKLEAGKVELLNEPFDIRRQIETVLNMSSTTAKSKDIYLKAEFSEEVQSAQLGDEGRLRQILLNLIGNAIKFTDSGGVTVKVALTAEQECLRFEIVDTGIGIANENIPKLFAEFSQAEASTANKYGGSGLGLAICKKLVEAMSGSIGITSKLGKGSIFWFEIPNNVSDVLVTKSIASTPDKQAENLNILVAEDNLPNQFLIKSILTKLGHRVTIANNGKEALAALDAGNSSFDLVLMDMQMPEMDGLQATRKIRRSDDDAIQQIPIIALTANAYDEVYESIISAGMNACLTKPIIIKDLQKAINQWGNDSVS